MPKGSSTSPRPAPDQRPRPLRDRVRAVDWRPWLVALYALSVLVVAIPKGLHHADVTFEIFRGGVLHLLHGQDLYARYADYADYYKYSPAFAVLFAPFGLPPRVVGLVLWDGLNALLLAWAVLRLLPDRRGAAVLALIFLEMFGAMQNSQSNSLVTALVILAFLALERRRQLGAALAIALGTAVKIFPLGAAALAVMYPRRGRFGAIFTGTLLAVFALPLLVVSPHQTAAQYASWVHFLPRDAMPDSLPGSGMHTGGIPEQLRFWFGYARPPWIVEGVGVVLFLIPLLAGARRWDDPDFRRRALCSLLVFLVIFNHRAESPSFVIALTGIAIWFVITPRSPLTVTLLVLTLAIVSLGASSAVPDAIRHGVVMHFRLKTVPCTLAWLAMQAELLGWRRPGARTPDAAAHGTALAPGR